MNKIVSGLLILVGIIHIIPVTGVLGAERLELLYGISIRDPNLEILMRHRAVLFGLLGLFLVYAAFKPVFQVMAIVAGFVSVISFMVMAWLVGGYNEAIQTVVIADVIALLALITASLILIFIFPHKSS